MRQTLQLNANYMPMRVITWQRAISMWFADKVEIIEEYEDEEIRSVSFSMKLPAVVRLLKQDKKSAKRQSVKFSRMNVFHRDKFQCQYCGVKPGIKNLNFDHVVPRSKGGKTNWTNIVTACYTCNGKKGNRLLSEVRDMRLLKEPTQPPVHEAMKFRFIMPKTPDAWRAYLYWNTELDEE